MENQYVNYKIHKTIHKTVWVALLKAFAITHSYMRTIVILLSISVSRIHVLVDISVKEFRDITTEINSKKSDCLGIGGRHLSHICYTKSSA